MLRYAALCAEPQPIKLSCSYPGNMSNQQKGHVWYCTVVLCFTVFYNAIKLSTNSQECLSIHR